MLCPRPHIYPRARKRSCQSANNEWLLAGYKIVMSIVWGSRWEMFIYQRNKQTSDILPSCKTMIWSTWGRKAIPCVTRIRVWQRRKHKQSIWLRLQEEMPRVCKSMFFMKASVLSKCDFIHSTIKAFRKWIYLGWFKLVLLFLCIKFVDKLILPLFLVHTVFMILSLLCALTPPLPSPLLFPREQIKGATIHKIICF